MGDANLWVGGGGVTTAALRVIGVTGMSGAGSKAVSWFRSGEALGFHGI